MQTDDSQVSVLHYFSGILKKKNELTHTGLMLHYMPSYCVLTSIDVDECVSGPCQNGGTCVDQVNGYLCQCAPGYTDLQCHTGKGTDQLEKNSIRFVL